MGNKLLILLILLALAFIGFTKYNQMANMEKGLKSQWTLIERQYEHKSDVIFDLSKHISDNIDEDLPVFDKITRARNSTAQIVVEPDKISEQSLNSYRSAYQELITLQFELFELAKQYPEVANYQEFRELKTELEGTEIRIANERRRLNDQVAQYNKYINGFFNIAIAQVFGFKEWPSFTPILGE